MAFDGIITKSIVAELSNNLLLGKINKVFQPSKNEVILGIYCGGKNFALNICIDSNNYRIHLSTKNKPNPLNAPNFCMLLRKHILGYKIKNIENYDLERIIIINLEGYNELNDLTTKKLVIELMGKHSNIILLNNKDFIIDSLRHLDISSHSYRDILPARPYVFPENEKHSFINLNGYSEFKNILLNSNDLPISNNIVNNFIGFSFPFIQNVLDKLNINKDFLTSSISDIDLNNIYNYISSLIAEIGSNKISCIDITNEKEKKDYTIDFSNKESTSDINFFLDDFYFSKEINESFFNYRNTVLKLILNKLTKYSNRIKNIDKKLLECSEKDKYKLYGELITANLYRYREQNLNEITVENYYDNNNPIIIPLDSKISVQKNSVKYFKKYNKLKNALDIVSKQKLDAKNDIDYLESIIYELENSKNINEVNEIYNEISQSYIFSEHFAKKQKKFSERKTSTFSPREYEISGYTVLVGKNNIQNDYLTTKLADKNDIWFHTKDIHGSHVILRTNNELDINDDILVKCAEIAAFYSKAKLSSNVPVDYCFVRYVKKPSGSKPGMVIYTNNKTINVTPKEPI